MKPSGNRGVTMFEVLICIVLIAFVTIPTIQHFARVEDAKADIDDGLRRAAIQSLQEQLIVSGIDPLTADAFAAEQEEASIAKGLNFAALSQINRESIDQGAGAMLSVISLQSLNGETPAAMGVEIGKGGEPPPWESLGTPLDPIFIPDPVLDPASATPITVDFLVPSGGDEPSVLPLTADAGDPDTIVHLVLDSPFTESTGAGTAGLLISSTDLENGVTGSYWAEYNGAAVEGALSQSLGDGRTRWWVLEDGGWQAYNPSPRLPFVFGLTLPAPIMVLDGVEYTTGSSLSVTWLDREAYSVSAYMTFPADVIAAFGDQWESIRPEFSTTFDGRRDGFGPSDGDITSFFGDDTVALDRWRDAPDSNTIHVESNGSAGLTIPDANFFVTIEVITLDPPVLDSDPYDDAGDGTWEGGGTVTYTAPVLGSAPIGWLQIDSTRVADTEAEVEL